MLRGHIRGRRLTGLIWQISSFLDPDFLGPLETTSADRAFLVRLTIDHQSPSPP